MEAMSFYELLGIPKTETLGEIKQAYKQLARKYHPDVSPPGLVEEYTQKFNRVQKAYETLSDPCWRALYDEDMAEGLHFAFSTRKSCKNDETMVISQWWIMANTSLAEEAELQCVPGKFESVEDYVRVFEPLLFEECRAQLKALGRN